MKQEVSYILCTLFANQTEGTICANILTSYLANLGWFLKFDTMFPPRQYNLKYAIIENMGQVKL